MYLVRKEERCINSVFTVRDLAGILYFLNMYDRNESTCGLSLVIEVGKTKQYISTDEPGKLSFFPFSNELNNFINVQIINSWMRDFFKSKGVVRR